MKLLAIAAATLLAAAASSPAFADDWRFSVAPYLWLPGLKGNVISTPGRPPVDVEADFADLLDNLEGALMLKGEVGYGRWAFLADVDYLGLGEAENIVVGGVIPVGASFDASTLDGTLALAYRVYDGADVDVDLLGGARYTSVDIDLEANLGAFRFTGGQERDWWDPIIGARASWQFGKSSLRLYGDYGGFGMEDGSDAVWQVFVGYGYRFAPWCEGVIGYRHYDVDFDDGRVFKYNIELGGPLIGLQFDF